MTRTPSMTRTPQVLIALSPAGELQMELPGANGSRRVVPLTRDIEATLKRVLQAQALEPKTEIGHDGQPTERQVLHWEQHSVFPEPSCPFCRAEGRAKAPRGPRHSKPERHNLGDGVTVRKLKPKGKAAKRGVPHVQHAIGVNPSDLGI